MPMNSNICTKIKNLVSVSDDFNGEGFWKKINLDYDQMGYSEFEREGSTLRISSCLDQELFPNIDFTIKSRSKNVYFYNESSLNNIRTALKDQLVKWGVDLNPEMEKYIEGVVNHDSVHVDLNGFVKNGKSIYKSVSQKVNLNESWFFYILSIADHLDLPFEIFKDILNNDELNKMYNGYGPKTHEYSILKENMTKFNLTMNDCIDLVSLLRIFMVKNERKQPKNFWQIGLFDLFNTCMCPLILKNVKLNYQRVGNNLQNKIKLYGSFDRGDRSLGTLGELKIRHDLEIDNKYKTFKTQKKKLTSSDMTSSDFVTDVQLCCLMLPFENSKPLVFYFEKEYDIRKIKLTCNVLNFPVFDRVQIMMYNIISNWFRKKRYSKKNLRSQMTVTLNYALKQSDKCNTIDHIPIPEIYSHIYKTKYM